MAEGGVMRKRTGGEGTLRVALAFAAFLGSLSLVIWRQSRALEVLRELDGARVERAAVESDKSRNVEEIQVLESRGRIAGVAGTQWGMRVPSSDEEFVIMLRPDEGDTSPVTPTGRSAAVTMADLPPGRE
jgi:cell division protein FtsL